MDAQNLGPTNSITRKLALKLFKLCKGDDYERTLRSVAYDIMFTSTDHKLDHEAYAALVAELTPREVERIEGFIAQAYADAEALRRS